MQPPHTVHVVVQRADSWTPTDAQLSWLKDVCSKLQKPWKPELDTIDSQEQFTARMEQLKAERAQVYATMPMTTKQSNFLLRLGMAKADVKKIKTASAASARIEQLLAERGSTHEAPTKNQMEFLRKLGYSGEAPESKSRASKIISLLHRAKAIEHFVSRGRTLHLSEAQLQRLEGYMSKMPRRLMGIGK
jgi:hypothetical protein